MISSATASNCARKSYPRINSSFKSLSTSEIGHLPLARETSDSAEPWTQLQSVSPGDFTASRPIVYVDLPDHSELSEAMKTPRPVRCPQCVSRLPVAASRSQRSQLRKETDPFPTSTLLTGRIAFPPYLILTDNLSRSLSIESACRLPKKAASSTRPSKTYSRPFQVAPAIRRVVVAAPQAIAAFRAIRHKLDLLVLMTIAVTRSKKLAIDPWKWGIT